MADIAMASDVRDLDEILKSNHFDVVATSEEVGHIGTAELVALLRTYALARDLALARIVVLERRLNEEKQK
jgi:hypothetical protein